MKCPYCHQEMKQGVIQSPYEIFWTQNPLWINRSFFHDDAIVLSKHNNFKGSKALSYLCQNCEKVIIDYSGHSCDTNKTKKE